MSRSYKHNPEYVDFVTPDTSFKKIFNRRLRRSQKCQDIPSGNAYKKMNCSWLIRDWHGYMSEKEYLEGEVECGSTLRDAKNTYKKVYRSK